MNNLNVVTLPDNLYKCLNQDLQDLRMYRIEFFKSCYIWATQIPTFL